MGDPMGDLSSDPVNPSLRETSRGCLAARVATAAACCTGLGIAYSARRPGLRHLSASALHLLTQLQASGRAVQRLKPF